MKTKKLVVITLSLVLLLQPFIITQTSKAFSNISIDRSNSIMLQNNSEIRKSIGLGGEEHLVSNIVRNGGFEETSYNGGPEYLNYYGSAFANGDGTYQGTVYAGAYAGLIQCEGNSQWSTTGYMYRNLMNLPERIYLNEQLELDVWVDLISNPDLAQGGNIFIRIRLYHSPSSTTYYIFYYLSTTVGLTNDTTHAYFYVPTPFSSWENFHRDLTSDFTISFGPSPNTVYIENVYFYVESPVNPSGRTQLAIDDAGLENSTNYNYFDLNGGFEDGDGSYWFSNNRGEGSVLQTDDHTEGNKAINLTAIPVIDGIQGYAYLESYIGQWGDPGYGYYARDPGEFTMEFDWKYNDIPGAGNWQYAYFYISGTNGSCNAFYGWFLGIDGDSITWSNSTSPTSVERYFEAEGFGVRDSWHHFSIDLNSYFTLDNVVNMPIVYTGFSIYSGYDSTAHTELLIDDYQLETLPTGDPFFEEDWYWSTSNPIPSWQTNAQDSYVNITSDSFYGSNAANVTSFDGYGTVYAYRDMYLNVPDNLFTDFWWKLESINTGNDAFSYIRLDLDNGYRVNYILGTNENYNPSNSTYNVFYNVEGFNQTGIWTNVARNVAEDITQSFGGSNWNITQIRLASVSSDFGQVTTALFDSIQFVQDTTGPYLISQNLINTPTYYQSAILEIMAADTLSRVYNTKVYYRTGTTWDYVTATTMGMYFYATIPAFDYGNIIEYYFVMTDIFGAMGVDDNSGLYYSYDIVDDINPTVNILNVTTAARKGLSEMSILAFDDGSAIDHLEIFDNGISIGNISTSINDVFKYTWDPDVKQEGGIRTLRIEAHDNAGNIGITEMEIGVELPSAFIAFFQTWGTLIGAVIVGAAWGTVVLIRVFKKLKT